MMNFSDDDRCVAPKPTSDSVRVGRAPRTPTGRVRRYMFGPVWFKNVLNKNVTDHDKLIAHGVSLCLGDRETLAAIPFGKLLHQVRIALCAYIREEVVRQREICDTMQLFTQPNAEIPAEPVEKESEMGKMIKATAQTEFQRHKLLTERLASGYPGVTAEMVQSALNSATSLLEAEHKANVEKFRNKHGAADWYKAVRAHYDIVEENLQFRVISSAKDWTEETRREWVCASRWEAEDKINNLIMYRQNDLKRGHGDPEKHIERGVRLMEARLAAA